MSQQVQTELKGKTQQLLEGPLKHIRGAALAAALLPLASVAATPAAAQSQLCASGGICGFVFNDANNNGIQDAGEIPIVGASVTLDGLISSTIPTDSNGFFFFEVFSGTHVVAVQIPPGTTASPHDVGSDDTIDSDGVPDGVGNSVASAIASGAPTFVDFGFFASPVRQPGTGTPGYWKNHPEAWPVTGITVGGVNYSLGQAIGFLESVGKDKTTTMFSSLVSAKLNVLVGNDSSCVASTITAADAWMAAYGPVGHNVAASSYAWKVGEPLHRLMDNYNNGMLCAPHRN